MQFMAISSLSLLMLASCKKTDAVITTNGGTAGQLSVSASTLVLSKAKVTDTTTVVKFSTTNANYGYTSATTTTLQLDLPGNNWVSPISITLPAKATSQGYSTADFNTLMLKLGLPTGVAGQVATRVSYSVGTSVKTIYSNVVTLTVTPFNLTSFVYVPGAYQNWLPPSADSLISVSGNGIYTGIINFPVGKLTFKITPDKTWANSYGATGSTLVYNGGSDIPAPAAGLTIVTVNLNTNTVSFSTPAHYYSIIGDATPGGWDNDTDMKFDNGNQVWTVTAPFTAAPNQAFKIRADHAWGTSYGLPKTPDGMTLTSASGGNIPVTVAGTYKITFAVNAADVTLATYTMVKK